MTAGAKEQDAGLIVSGCHDVLACSREHMSASECAPGQRASFVFLPPPWPWAECGRAPPWLVPSTVVAGPAEVCTLFFRFVFEGGVQLPDRRRKVRPNAVDGDSLPQEAPEAPGPGRGSLHASVACALPGGWIQLSSSDVVGGGHRLAPCLMRHSQQLEWRGRGTGRLFMCSGLQRS